MGHALFNDLAALRYQCIYANMRDTALFYPLRERMGVVLEGNYPSLKKTVREVMGEDIQKGEHCPVGRALGQAKS